MCGEEGETLKHIFESCKWTKCGKEAKKVIRHELPDVEKMLRVLKVRREKKEAEERPSASAYARSVERAQIHLRGKKEEESEKVRARTRGLKSDR